MFRIRPGHGTLIIFAGIFFTDASARVMDIKSSASLDMQYTDNATKVAANKAGEMILTARAGARIDADTGPFQLDMDTSLQSIDYRNETYDNQQYFNLNATADWTMLKNRLDWKLQDFFTQQSIDSLNPDRPDNAQDTNVLTFGPNIYYRISGLQSFTLRPEYRKFSYEIQNIDNQQNALDVSWNYQLYRTMNVGLRGGLNETDYDDPLLTDNTFNNIHITLSATRQDYNYSVDLGATRVDRKGGDSVRGITGNISWLFDITANSTLRSYVSSDLTDSNNSLLNASINPDAGDFSNEQSSSEVSRNSIFRLSYQRSDATLKSDVWIGFRKLDYEFALLDREVRSAGFGFNYPLTAVLSAGINARYSGIDLIDTGRKDDQYSIGWDVSYRLSRKLLGVLDIKYNDKDSSVDIADYREMSAYIGLVYGYGK